MRETFIVAAVVSLSILTACGGGVSGSTQLADQSATTTTDSGSVAGSGSNGSPTLGASSTSSWTKVAYTATCEAMNPRFCLGRYGLTIDSSGHFAMGPNSNEQTIEGQLTAQELTTLKKSADPVTADYNAGAAAMCPRPFLPGVSQRIVIAGANSGQDYVVKDAFRQYCGPNKDTGDTLVAVLVDLTKKYYPVPF